VVRRGGTGERRNLNLYYFEELGGIVVVSTVASQSEVSGLDPHSGSGPTVYSEYACTKTSPPVNDAVEDEHLPN